MEKTGGWNPKQKEDIDHGKSKKTMMQRAAACYAENFQLPAKGQLCFGKPSLEVKMVMTRWCRATPKAGHVKTVTMLFIILAILT